MVHWLRTMTALALILVCASATAQLLPGFGGLEQPELVRMSLAFDRSDYAPGDAVRGAATVVIEQEWHINSARPIEDFAIPTTLSISAPSLENIRLSFPPHHEKAFEFAGGGTLAVYDGTIVVAFEATRTAATDRTVTAALRYQACNDQVCLAPREITETTLLGASLLDAPLPAGEGFVPLDQAPADGGGTSSLFGSDLGSTLLSRGLPLTLLVIFVLGLALNLTPCVYPLVPITVAFFTSQAEGKRSTRSLLAVAYVLGIAVTYSALGVFSATTGRLFGAWLQHAGVLIFFALLMLVLSSSMFGLFDIRVPRFIMQRSGARSGIVGALTMGLFAGIVAAPCVGPFIISLIALVGQIGSIPLGLTMFFVLALGLGTPYLFLGIFSSSVSAMPRSGPWLVQVKKGIGFVLIAMAFFFLRPLTGDDIYYWGIAASLLAGAIYLLLFRVSGSGRTVQYVMATLLVVGGVSVLLGRNTEPGIIWTPYDPAVLDQAATVGRPVVIDFYADWCLPCKELEAKTFTHEGVRSEADRFTRLKADLTRVADPQTQALSERFGIIGVPTIVLIDSTGSEVESLRLTGFEDGERFLRRLEQIR